MYKRMVYPMRAVAVAGLLMLWTAVGAGAFGPGGEPSGAASHSYLNAQSSVINPDAPPAGYIHRPVAEFFTGLSCPSCMDGPHQDMEKLWEENGYKPEQPRTMVVFHELNGGGVDDLATDDSKERMRYYQPGVSGTPDAEFDGGFIELGGMTGGTLNYQSASDAYAKSESRADGKINPLHPWKSVRAGFRLVRLTVDQSFNGDGFGFVAEATLLGSTAPLDTRPLHGTMYVFFVEDNVTAFSTVLKSDVNNHNVFRGYGLKDKQFTIKKGESFTISGSWEIPADAKVPVKAADVSAVAVVYDMDDTSSEDGNSGNPSTVPRTVQSATPLSSAFDRLNDIPLVTNVTARLKGDSIIVTAEVDDANGTSAAFLFYNYNSTNSSAWNHTEMNVTGKEQCTEGACSAFADAHLRASIPAKEGKAVYVRFLVYDGNGTEGKTVALRVVAGAGSSPRTVPGGYWPVVIVASVAVLGLLAYRGFRRGRAPVTA